MKVKKLYTAGDGFCCNHIWPMWSKLLAEILDCEWVNLSTYGAGNEAIANLVTDEIKLNQDYSDTLWLIQWTLSPRLDLRIDCFSDDNQYLKLIPTDPVYYDNFISTTKQKKYWCSSASQLPFVTDYNKLLSVNQHNDRSRHHQMSTAYALSQTQANWKFLLTYPANWLPTEFIDHSRWIFPSMAEFRKTSQYSSLDVGEVQPVSSIHLDFLEQFILPKCEYDPLRFKDIKHRILSDDQNRIKSKQS
jgi:hypothetical protein